MGVFCEVEQFLGVWWTTGSQEIRMNAKISRKCFPEGQIWREFVDQYVGNCLLGDSNCGGQIRFCQPLTGFSMNKSF